MIPAITTMAMISQSHHRLLPLSPPVGAAALLEVTALDEAGANCWTPELLDAELEVLDGVGDGVGEGVGVGLDGVGGGAVTSKLATPTVPDFCADRPPAGGCRPRSRPAR